MGAIRRFFDGFTWKGKAVMGLLAVVLVLAVGVVIGQRAESERTVAGGDDGPAADATVEPTLGVPTGLPSAPPGDSQDVRSSTGVDYGAGLPRLGESQYAKTKDPVVFAASVWAASGYDYAEYQPEDILAEADRITTEMLAGMDGTDGPLGAEVHDALRGAVSRSVDPDELEYRVAARQHDTIDVTKVETLSPEDLHADIGDNAYLKVVENRSEGIYQYNVWGDLTTEMQAVGDTAGWKRTVTTGTHILVHCPDGGYCSLIGIVGQTRDDDGEDS
ncbi:hypothetical protein [Actinomyces succiniciruminis]|uniref:Uncharacterized protein n=1 Tax=Actinomyces succiniciruminis TaxID=1522002 RepID=A0A1L7RRZ7_9ACTO|nr:hypothetical protein [Actinomyces succiniciruminis]CED91953.1 Hypothetical protein AAM4_2121 [Actinomyces succiniciruminis]